MKEAKIKGTVSLNTARMGQMKRSLLSIALASMGLGLGVAGHAQNLNLQSTARVQNSQEDKFALNFVNADIDAVVRAIGSFTNQTFVVDPRVRGTISLVSPQPLSAADAKNALLAALRLQGFTIVESGGIARVLPENDAKVQADSVDPRKAMNQSGNAIVTQVFQLNYESATALVPVLRPLIAPNNTIAAYPNNNTLVITDYADNLQRIARIIASIDGPYSGDLEVVPLEHALAVDLAAILGRMLDEGNRGTGAAVDAGQRLSVMADPRTNSLLLRTPSKARLNLAKALIAKLDQPTKQPGNVWVVYLKNAEAAKLAKTLQAVLSSSPISDNNSSSGLSSLSGGLAGGLGGDTSNTNNSTRNITNGSAGLGGSSSLGSSLGGGTSSGQLSAASGNVDLNNGGIVQADPSTNSLIITAPEPIYRNLRSIIEKLDVRRAQVFVESLIVEVSTDKAAEFGIQFQGLSGVGADGVRVIGGTNFNDPGSGSNILGAATNLGSVGRGLNIGVIDGQVNIPGIGTISNLGFLARALESKANANILSTPNILTLDNEEAKIVIGQNVPFITGQFTNSGGNGATVNPFQTIERQDVGLTLRVKPQVSEGGIVKLGIFQEVSSVVDSTNVSGIITNKRSIESNVLVETGNIIVLGGLVEDRVTGNEEKVPGLGDVPVLGQFFRYDNRRRQKTNLMVFLRPVVVRNEDQAQSIVTNRYDYMRQLQQENQPERRFGLPNMEAPVLPSRRPADVARPNTVAPAQGNGDSINLTPSNRILVIPRAGESSSNSEVGPNGGRIIRGRTSGNTP
ncbi:type II secretion system secretin GspD [Limnobacter profundi]|uniref:Type II secretion system secretin GspD n=1 Tax=Limnobacter profundi TaxID=2732163 RepID=A0ABX6NA09_9BURK|nr:type II secretion system secretin GspD [Limnobacter sp. SAORIC-580]QJR30831.1 type II secretion system secretin GspD [Limnobacter sp. SAORIC-580]